MRFAGIRKFSGSGSARNRSFGVQLVAGSTKWKELHYSEGGVVEKSGSLRIKNSLEMIWLHQYLKADDKVSRGPLPIFSTVVATRFELYV